jgi:hypothetical protein
MPNLDPGYRCDGVYSLDSLCGLNLWDVLYTFYEGIA